jgi:hypothetical protein
MSDIADPQGHQGAAAQLAVDRQIEQRQLSRGEDSSAMRVGLTLEVRERAARTATA